MGEVVTMPEETLTPAQVRKLAASIAESFLEQMDGRALGAAALARTIEAGTEPDALRQANKLREGQILASLSLTDAIQEATATLKEVANRQIDSTLRRAA